LQAIGIQAADIAEPTFTEIRRSMAPGVKAVDTDIRDRCTRGNTENVRPSTGKIEIRCACFVFSGAVDQQLTERIPV